MEDYLLMLAALMAMATACFIQFLIAKSQHSFSFLLPLLFGIATFWLGLISLLFAFVLVFIGELCAKENIKVGKSE